MIKHTFFTFVILSCVLAGRSEADERRYSLKAENQAEVQATYKDIKDTLGIVPGFLRDYPRQSITGAWQELKNVQMSNTTAISPKDKELIGLAVSSQIPCSFCADFHTEAAKANGATPEELHEAIAVASCTRHWSTYFHGTEVDPQRFRGAADRMLKGVQEMSARQGKQPDSVQKPALSTADEAKKDMESTFGFVPFFVEKFPEAGLAGAWSDFKMLELNEHTAISPKVKNLISLGVAAQIPCEHCIYFDKQAAKANGASDAEIQEAVTMAALSRKWSTVLNGLRTDPVVFKKEVTAIFNHGKQQQKKKN